MPCPSKLSNFRKDFSTTFFRYKGCSNTTVNIFSLKVCAALRKMTSVLRLGVYRERIEKYGSSSRHHATSGGSSNQGPQATSASTSQSSSCSHQRKSSAMHSSETDSCCTNSISPASNSSTISPRNNLSNPNKKSRKDEELLTIKLERQTGKQLGIRLSGGDTEPTAGIFVADIQEGSSTSMDGRLRKLDRILYINGRDVRNSKLSQASALIQVREILSANFVDPEVKLWRVAGHFGFAERFWSRNKRRYSIVLQTPCRTFSFSTLFDNGKKLWSPSSSLLVREDFLAAQSSKVDII